MDSMVVKNFHDYLDGVYKISIRIQVFEIKGFIFLVGDSMSKPREVAFSRIPVINCVKCPLKINRNFSNIFIDISRKFYDC